MDVIGDSTFFYWPTDEALDKRLGQYAISKSTNSVGKVIRIEKRKGKEDSIAIEVDPGLFVVDGKIYRRESE